ncbi:MAG: zf-HC2 domain-containing protein [Pseudomonadota bacterium]
MTRTTKEPGLHKDRLAAFVDGELSPEEAAAVVMHLADHPADQAHVDDLIAANEALALAFAAPLAEPVPPAMRALILGEGATVLPYRRRAPLVVAGAGVALAAGLAVAALIVPQAVPGLQPGRVADSSALARVLAQAPSGTPQALDAGREVLILASLPTPAGFCREVEVLDRAADRLDLALACTSGAGWQVEMVLTEALSGPAAGGFVPASGAEVQGIGPFLDRIGAGPALDAATEARLIAAGWGAAEPARAME